MSHNGNPPRRHSHRLRLSRRSALKGGLALLGGTLFAKAAAASHDRTGAQADPKRIYLAPDDHTDYIWSAGEGEYRQAFLETLNYYLDQADKDIAAKQPALFHSRWNCDGHFWLWTYEQNQTAAQFERLISRIRDGHISVPLNALCVCLGGAPAEAVLRGMYYPGRVERRYNVRFPLAYAMENQTLPYGLGALWAGSGAKYSWKGVCGCSSSVPDLSDRQHEIYWWVGPDGSRILMKWHSLLDGNESIGGYAEARDPQEVVEIVDRGRDFLARYAYRVIGAFGQGFDDVKTLTRKIVDAAVAKTTASRQIIVSNEVDFFQDVEATYGSRLPSLSCSFGNEWDVDCALMAEVSARAKRAVETLRGAEAMATLVSLQNPRFMEGREKARDLAFLNLGLFWEHDWAGAPTTELTRERIAWQKRIVQEIERYVNTLHAEAASALGGLIRKTGANLRFFAFNPLSWARTDIADFPFSDAASVHVVDVSTRQEVPSQRVILDGIKYLRVLAANVPAVGYKVFEVRSGAGQDFSAGAPAASGSSLENAYYRLTVANRGAITHLVDKRRNREFARTVGGRAINDLGSGSGALAVENTGPVSVTLKAAASAASPLKHSARITLVRGSSRIDLHNTIDQNFDVVTTWGFGFNLVNPEVWHEEVGAVIRARLTSQTPAGHYSPRNARYDWLTLNHFADMSGGEVGVTLSNADCYFMQLGQSAVTSLDTSTPQISVLAGGGVNGYNSITHQGGSDQNRFLQRFALQTHDAYDPARAMKFALEHQNPLITGPVGGGGVYPETSYAFLALSNPDVLLWALKPAEDGPAQGIVVRVWNLSTSMANFSLSFAPGPATRAEQVTHIETPVGAATVTSGKLTAALNAQQIKTFLVSGLASKNI